jgi:hypothetical protein
MNIGDQEALRIWIELTNKRLDNFATAIEGLQKMCNNLDYRIRMLSDVIDRLGNRLDTEVLDRQTGDRQLADSIYRLDCK